MNYNMGIYSRINLRLEGLGLDLLYWANISLTIIEVTVSERSFRSYLEPIENHPKAQTKSRFQAPL